MIAFIVSQRLVAMAGLTVYSFSQDKNPIFYEKAKSEDR